ncbi:DcrB-related protein [Pantoea sp. A4]|uniref:DcrB-related protein n=1 Tax=Pantoea sp. A4 TaxID=1225184 RepID=UPI000371CBBF|nr:DUF1795 domain-containing protein [Pantoea sp. A4]
MTPRCIFTEGSVTLPDGYRDRTVNVLIATDETSPALNISRDSLNPGEDLAAYVTRQLASLADGLKGWAEKERAPAVLGDNVLQGEQVLATYLRSGQRVWQRQAVFVVGGDTVLVFTLAVTRKLTTEDENLLAQVLLSYTPGKEPQA